MNSPLFVFQCSHLHHSSDILLLQAEIMWGEILKSLCFSQAKLSEWSIIPDRIQTRKICLLSVVFHKFHRILICWMQILGTIRSCCAEKCSRGGWTLWCPRPHLFTPLSSPHCISVGQLMEGEGRVSVTNVLIWLLSPKARQPPRIEFSFSESQDADCCAPGAVQLHAAGYSGLVINRQSQP